MKGKLANYITIGTNNLERAKNFYDELFCDLHVKSFKPNERSIFWTIPGDDTMFAVFVPYDGEEASAGNGNMTGFTMKTEEDVNNLYEKAISLGAIDEGAPGQRATGFYGGYVRDLAVSYTHLTLPTTEYV